MFLTLVFCNGLRSRVFTFSGFNNFSFDFTLIPPRLRGLSCIVCFGLNGLSLDFTLFASCLYGLAGGDGLNSISVLTFSLSVLGSTLSAEIGA